MVLNRVRKDKTSLLKKWEQHWRNCISTQIHPQVLNLKRIIYSDDFIIAVITQFHYDQMTWKIHKNF